MRSEILKAEFSSAGNGGPGLLVPGLFNSLLDVSCRPDILSLLNRLKREWESTISLFAAGLDLTREHVEPVLVPRSWNSESRSIHCLLCSDDVGYHRS